MAKGEMTQDLLANVFKAYKAMSNREYWCTLQDRSFVLRREKTLALTFSCYKPATSTGSWLKPRPGMPLPQKKKNPGTGNPDLENAKGELEFLVLLSYFQIVNQ